jgi:hypothetical protein
MSLRGEVLGSYQASITPPTLIEVPVPRLENERSSTTNVRYINFASFYEFQLDIRALKLHYLGTVYLKMLKMVLL